jgi:hypothetical protein
LELKAERKNQSTLSVHHQRASKNPDDSDAVGLAEDTIDNDCAGG